ncbi:MAG TPA: hypothetical protein VIE64_09150 [Solirubrobacterales bacterium]
MLRRRHINADSRGSHLRAALAAATRPFRAVGWALRERVLWPAGDLLRSVGELLKWPFQRLGWAIERNLLWPFRERVSSWGYPHRMVGASALVAVAIGATALGALLASQEEPASGELALATSAALVNAQEEKGEQPGQPTLQGAPPVFGVADGSEVANAESDGEEGTASETDTSGQAEAESESEEEGAAAASSQKPVPAGPVAMKVARRFAEAFVFYEVGKRPLRAKTIFQETATTELADALSARPPRLPANVEVPQARVLNLVPGPRQAKTYTISASLLRVGTTSELRLRMQKLDGAWVITDVRG